MLSGRTLFAPLHWPARVKLQIPLLDVSSCSETLPEIVIKQIWLHHSVKWHCVPHSRFWSFLKMYSKTTEISPVILFNTSTAGMTQISAFVTGDHWRGRLRFGRGISLLLFVMSLLVLQAEKPWFKLKGRLLVIFIKRWLLLRSL